MHSNKGDLKFKVFLVEGLIRQIEFEDQALKGYLIQLI